MIINFKKHISMFNLYLWFNIFSYPNLESKILNWVSKSSNKNLKKSNSEKPTFRETPCIPLQTHPVDGIILFFDINTGIPKIYLKMSCHSMN